MPRSGLLFIAALAALALGLATAYLWRSHSPESDAGVPRYATVLPQPIALPAFSLNDHRDAPFTVDNLRGKTSLLFFGFTHCPDICPATLQQLTLARKQLQEDGAALPQIILISVDPERDSAEKLEQYVSHFGEGVSAATGAPDALTDLTSALGVWFGKEPSEVAGGDAGYTVSHATAVLLIDEDARWRAVFSAPHSTEHFVHDLPLLMAVK